jgi:hypothetical protein
VAKFGSAFAHRLSYPADAGICFDCCAIRGVNDSNAIHSIKRERVAVQFFGSDPASACHGGGV